jgi:hypothetical protein
VPDVGSAEDMKRKGANRAHSLENPEVRTVQDMDAR